MFHGSVERVDPRVISLARLRRTTLTGAILLALAVGASGCGSDDEPTTTDDPTTSTSAEPTPTATPTPTEAPLSAFEDRAPVKAARSFTVAVAKAVNAHDASLSSVAPLTTSHGLQITKQFFAKDDLDNGYELPGPQPFTPVSVQSRGGVAKLNVCLQNQGWSVDPTTGEAVHKRKVSAAVLEMRKAGKTWKFDDYYAGTADCAGVTVRGVPW